MGHTTKDVPPARPDLAPSLRAKYEQLQHILAGKEGLLVAFSGGVDSALLLAVARQAHQGRLVAATMSSILQPFDEREQAEQLAGQLGVVHCVVESRPLEDEAMGQNGPDRCYVCKKSIMTELLRLAQAEGLGRVVEGSNRDDEGDYRPGRRALRELSIGSPLMEAELTKSDVRALAHWLGLPNWDKPALACLASRVPYGEELTEERLRRIGQAEAWCRTAGFAQVRVRDHGDLARVEVPAEKIQDLTDEAVRPSLVAALKEAGYAYVAVDLEGYRTGAMNEVLAESARAGESESTIGAGDES
jgi:uncharacterized protein